MQMIASNIQKKSAEPLHQELPLSNIHLKSQKQKARERLCLSTVLQNTPPYTLINLEQQESNSLEFSFHPDQTLSSQADTHHKRREQRIFSIVHSAQRERSGSRSSNNSNWKEGRTGISLVSKEKKRLNESLGKQKKCDSSVGGLDSFTGTTESIALILAEKENKAPPAPVKIKQPEFLKSHPLRVGRITGSCMSKLIVQRALQERQHCQPNPERKPCS